MFWQKKAVKEPIKGPALSCLHTGFCSKEKCPIWLTINLTYMVDGQPKSQLEGRCSLAWTPSLLIEIKQKLAAAEQKVD